MRANQMHHPKWRKIWIRAPDQFRANTAMVWRLQHIYCDRNNCRGTKTML